MQLGKDFRDMLGELERHGVHYLVVGGLVVGGLAVALYGTPRYTKDLVCGYPSSIMSRW